MSKTNTFVGTFLRQKREVLGLNIKTVAQEISRTVQFISNIERGITALPVGHIPALSKLLGVDPFQFIDRLEWDHGCKLRKKLERLQKI